MYSSEISIVIAVKILPVVKKQHLLLCTLLLCNAAAMEVYLFLCVSFRMQFEHGRDDLTVEMFFLSGTSYFP